jgi:ADP-heptose:LPS heptosyltransferase
LRRPTVAILGPTDPQVVGIPETTEAVRVSLPCSPCARFAGWRACTNPCRYQCLHDITADMVISAVSRLMSPGVRLVVLEPALQHMLESVGQDAEVTA